MHHINQVEVIIGLLAAATMMTALAERLNIAYPILLMVGGLLIGFIPGIPTVQLDPQLVFLLFLPPLLYVSSLNTSWRDFKRNMRAISFLAVGLVLATAVTVALVVKFMAPDLGWAAAFVLGAIVSPSDIIAASAICRRLGVPKKVITILEGESLVNDATGLIAYRFAVVAVMTGAFSMLSAEMQFFYAGIGGIATGLVIGWITSIIRRKMNNNPLIATALSLLTPFVAYLPAEFIGVSGVLSVVVAGIYLVRKSSRMLNHITRLRITMMWDTLVFLMNAMIFTLIGLQLPSIMRGLSYSSLYLAVIAALVSFAVIATRLIWVPVFAYLPRILSKKVRESEPLPPPKLVFIVGWTGMRGILSLAAAMALPLYTETGAAFPERNLLIFLTFSVIFVTLVLQGLSLPPLIRMLGIKNDTIERDEELKGRAHSIKATIVHIDALMEKDPELAKNKRMKRIRNEYKDRLNTLHFLLEDGENEEVIQSQQEISNIHSELLAVAREALTDLRDRDIISDETMRKILFDIDLEESHLSIS